jgi:3'(2'), 5'-bisphosphate nucleotidase
MATAADHALAVQVAEAVGAELVTLRERLLAEGAGHGELGDAGDAHAQKLVLDLLGPALDGGDAILSEEGNDDPARLQAARVWVVDPLDGTNQFGHPGRPDWAVHVALVEDHSPTVGAVALPATNQVFTTSPAAVVPARDPDARLRVAVSRSRQPHLPVAIAGAVGADVVLLGSAGAKAMAVVQGEVDAYLHAGGQYEWDSCAPVAVAEAAGLWASRLDGSPLRYNQGDPYLPDLVICRPDLAEDLLATAVRLGASGHG